MSCVKTTSAKEAASAVNTLDPRKGMGEGVHRVFSGSQLDLFAWGTQTPAPPGCVQFVPAFAWGSSSLRQLTLPRAALSLGGNRGGWNSERLSARSPRSHYR